MFFTNLRKYQNTQLIASSLLLIGLSACGGAMKDAPGSEAGADAQSQAAHPHAAAEGSSVDASVEAIVSSYFLELRTNPEPNSYAAVVRWASGKRPQGVYRIVRTDAASMQEEHRSTSGDQDRFVDPQVTPDHHYIYAVSLLSPQGEVRELGRKEITIPKDAVIEGQVTPESVAKEAVQADGKHIWKMNGYERVFFKDGARLMLGANDLELKAAQIVALGEHGGTIETFAETAEATPRERGRPSGNVTIQAKNGMGHLSVIARGEKGGRGAEGGQGYAGAQGAYGFTPVERITEGGSDCGGGQRPGNGGVGAPGGTGGEGEYGRVGGAGGTITINLAESTPQFRIDEEAPGGEGGEGGLGGAGGPGGPGGHAGYVFTFDMRYPRVECGSGATGAAGPGGAQGPRGPAGHAGKHGQICEDIAGSRRGC